MKHYNRIRRFAAGSSIAVALLLFVTACGGKDTVASKSAAAFRDAQKKGIPVGGEAHGGHTAGGDHGAATDSSGDHATMTGMDHSTMTASTGSMAGMDHNNMPGMQSGQPMAGMDHSKMNPGQSMAGMDHSKMQPGQSMAGMDHSKMQPGQSMAGMDHSKMQPGQSMAGMDHSKMQPVQPMPGMDHSKMQPGQSMAGMNHSKMQPGQAMAGMDHSNMPGMQAGTTAPGQQPSAGMDHSDMSGMSQGTSSTATVHPPTTNSEMQRVRPASTLESDAFDAPAAAALSEAMKASQSGGHEGMEMRGITPGQDRENPPTPAPAFRDRPARGGSAASAMDHSQHGQAAPPGATVYTCPMHPEVKRDKPGTCPKCGMALVKKK